MSYKDKVESKISSLSSKKFNGNYLCPHVKELCDILYENGFRKDTPASPLSDQIVFCYFISRSRHRVFNDEVVFDGD